MPEISRDEQRSKILEVLQPREQDDSCSAAISEACVLELAERAIDTDENGHRDSRSSAVSLLVEIAYNQGQPDGPKIYAQCDREGCGTEVLVNVFTDSLEQSGECTGEEVCIKALWQRIGDDDTSTNDEIEKEGIYRFGGSAGYFCHHMGCSYSCGWSEDGIAGEHGDCKNE